MPKSRQTVAMVKSLPASGAVVVVHSVAVREDVKRMVSNLRGPDVATVTSVRVCNRRDLVEGYLTGVRIPVVVDYAFWANVPNHVAKLVTRLAAGANLVARYRPAC